MTHLPGVSGPARAAASAALAPLLLMLLLAGCSGGGDDADAKLSPSGTESSEAVPHEPGRVLSADPYDGEVADGVTAWRVRYSTTDHEGRARAATGVVVAPSERDEQRALVGVPHPTTGLADDCAPSRPATIGSTVGTLARLAQRGWVVVVPDYAGMGTPGDHHYLVGKAAAHDVLDALRATRELVPGAVGPTVLWGHSQGGHAALWAGSEAPSYAPELALSGVAATGAPTNLREIVRRLEEAPTAAMVTAFVVAAWDRAYPDAGILRQVPAGSRPLLEELRTTCVGGADFGRAIRLAKQLKGRLLAEDAYAGRLGELLEENSPSGRMEAPLLVGQGSEDAVVPVDVTRAWVDRLCDRDGQVDYRQYPGGHSVLVSNGPMLDEVLAWMEARVAGEPAGSTCG